MEKEMTKALQEINAAVSQTSNDELKKFVTEKITAIFRMQDAKALRTKKFNIYDYVSKDENYPLPLSGVYHDKENGMMVASDCKILVAVAAAWHKEYDNKVIAKDGHEVNHGRSFPHWKCVIPREFSAEFTITREIEDEFHRFVKECRALAKTNGKGKRWGNAWVVKVGNTVLRAEHFAKVLTAMRHIECTTLKTKEDNFQSVFAQNENGVVLCMPIVAKEEDSDIYKIFEIA